MKKKLLIILFIYSIISISQAQSINGPDAPVLSFIQNNNQLDFTLSNPPISNNYNNLYFELDTNSSFVKFEGYLIYQLKSDTTNLPFSPTFPLDTNQYKLVFQCDSINIIDSIYDYTFDSVSQNYDSTLKVSGNNTGLINQFSLLNDAFTNSAFDFNNHDYCFVALAYAYRFDTNNVFINKQFVHSRRSFNGSIKKVCLSQLSSVKNNLSELITISPNPFSESITIDLGNIEDATISIINSLGQNIKNINSKSTSKTINLSNLNNGVYFVSITSNLGQKVTKKIIKY